MEIVDGIWIRATDHSAVFISRRIGMKPDSLKALLEVVNQPRSRVSTSPGFASVDLLFWSSYPWDFFVFSDGMDFL